ARAEGGGCERDRFGPKGLYRVEFLSPALEQDADKIDHHVGVARGRFDRGRMAHIGLHGMDLPDPAERLQEAGKLRAAHGDTNAGEEVGEWGEEVGAEETGAAEDGDERFERNGGHAR